MLFHCNNTAQKVSGFLHQEISVAVFFRNLVATKFAPIARPVTYWWRTGHFMISKKSHPCFQGRCYKTQYLQKKINSSVVPFIPFSFRGTKVNLSQSRAYILYIYIYILIYCLWFIQNIFPFLICWSHLHNSS